jgi:hypothetical protein
MTSTLAIALAQAANGLHESARAHKRASGAHRRWAREDMQKLDELKRTCADLGIELKIDTNSEDHGGHGDAERINH